MEGRSGGKITSFVPAGRFMWVGYKTLSFLCLDCGFVGQQLSAAQVAEIKQKHAGL